MVSVNVRVFSTVVLDVTLDGREPEEVRPELPILRHVFEDVAPGVHTVEVRGITGHFKGLVFVGPSAG